MFLYFTEEEIEEIMIFYKLYLKYYYEDYKKEIEKIFKEN